MWNWASQMHQATIATSPQLDSNFSNIPLSSTDSSISKNSLEIFPTYPILQHILHKEIIKRKSSSSYECERDKYHVGALIEILSTFLNSKETSAFLGQLHLSKMETIVVEALLQTYADIVRNIWRLSLCPVTQNLDRVWREGLLRWGLKHWQMQTATAYNVMSKTVAIIKELNFCFPQTN